VQCLADERRLAADDRFSPRSTKEKMLAALPSEGLSRLPDFRNFGVMIRALILAEAVNLLALLGQAPSLSAAPAAFAGWAPSYELVVLLALLLLAWLSPALATLPYRLGVIAVLGLVALVAMTVGMAIHEWLVLSLPVDPLKTAVLAAAVGGLILAYFDWRRRRLSPALGEARLAALQARIRPHFLFNCLNTVVAVVRQDPATAERILLDLSDLFRAVLVEERGLVSLDQEIELARAYGEIESLRLGDRLRLHWEVDEAVLTAQVPVLVLQPLLENAVRYGAEPEAAGGDVWLKARRVGRDLRLEVRNSMSALAAVAPGNGIALANLRERLALHYDAEARLRTAAEDGSFVVKLDIPLVAPEHGAMP